MAFTITHSVVSGAAANPDYDVDGPAWDANHTITGSVTASEITGAGDLTKTDDTNVTLTLGGTPTGALLKATSITVGWTGSLAVTRGGTGLSTTTQGDILYADASNSLAKLAKDTNATRYLSNTGTSNNPAWAQVALSTGISGFGANVATFLGTPSSANLISAVTDETGSGSLVFANTPTLVTPVLGVATATSVNKVTITAPATSATLTLTDGTTLTGPAASGTAMTLGNTETVTGVKTFGSAGAVGRLKVAGTTSGTTVLDATAVASGTLTLPAATDTLVGKATTDTLTNKTLDSAGTGNVLQVSSVTISRGQFPGFNTNSSATAGNWGEYVESVIASGSAVAATTGTPSNVTSISLTAGNWIVFGSVLQNPAATTSFTASGFSISTTSATLDGTYIQFDRYAAFVPANPFGGFTIARRLSLSGTTTVYLVQQCTFTVSTTGGYGTLFAYRI